MGIGRPRAEWKLPVDEVRQRYEAGESAQQLAEACGLKSYATIIRTLRDLGVEIRKPGGAKRLKPRKEYEAECQNERCSNTFRTYASRNRKFCSPECRYTDDRVLGLIASNIQGKHRLAEIDESARRAVCAVCGPVDIRQRTEPRTHQVHKKTWRCREAERVRFRVYTYGVSREKVEDALRQQAGVCAICAREFVQTFHVDHCHKTGAFRGILCRDCNRGIGFLGDSPDRLEAAAAYLREASKERRQE